MKNVYDAVSFFYEQDTAWDEIIKYEWVEGYLRRKAWHKSDDDKLQHMWHQILMLGLYLAYSDISVRQINTIDYEEMISWLERNVAEFNVNKKEVHDFFSVIVDFYDYLISKKVLNDANSLKKAFARIYNGKERILNKKEWASIYNKSSFVTPDAPVPIYLKLDEHLQSLLYLLNKFYQSAEYVLDFERAMFLYHGIMGWEEDSFDDQKQEFWLGFWDYFLFDYHLIYNDKTPLSHFFDNASYPLEIKQLLEELIQARFSVFSTISVATDDWVECEDLFTEKRFFLPNPGDDSLDLKENIFMGHLFSRNMVLINYVISIMVSQKLRKRIKEDVSKQIDYFRVQEPNAEWAEFFSRHSMALRHTIDIFTAFSKLNAVAEVDKPEKVKRISYYPQKIFVPELLIQIMSDQGYSFHDCQIVLRMWFDIAGTQKIIVRNNKNWALGLLLNFVEINSSEQIDINYFTETFAMSKATLLSYKQKVAEILSLVTHDIRYLNEEGFILLLLKH